MADYMHPNTKQAFERFVIAKPHALLLSGQAGAGKTHLAKVFIATVLAVEDLSLYPYFSHISDTNEGIAAIRQLKDFVNKKTIGSNNIRRAILLENADGLSQEAQNALLKLIEEPPEDTILLLTAVHTTSLLPTILSRVQLLPVLPLESSQLEDIQVNDPPAVQRAYHISGGNVGLLLSLLGQEEHPVFTAVATAKELIQAKAVDRLAQIDVLTKDKSQLNQIIEAMQRIMALLFQQAAAKTPESAIKIHKKRQLITQAQRMLQHNANQKLVLTHLFLNI